MSPSLKGNYLRMAVQLSSGANRAKSTNRFKGQVSVYQGNRKELRKQNKDLRCIQREDISVPLWQQFKWEGKPLEPAGNSECERERRPSEREHPALRFMLQRQFISIHAALGNYVPDPVKLPEKQQ